MPILKSSLPKKSSYRKQWKVWIGVLLLLLGLGYYHRIRLTVRCLMHEKCARMIAPLLKFCMGPEGYADFYRRHPALGTPPLEIGPGQPFTFQHLPDLSLFVPRQYLSYLIDEQPDGKINGLYLKFYFPGLILGFLPGLSSAAEALNPELYCPGGKFCFTQQPPRDNEDIEILDPLQK